MQGTKPTSFKKNSFEQNFWADGKLICGIDEVGRGCLAGPVVTAAAILHPHTTHTLLIDSKKLSHENLIKMHNWLIPRCTFSIAINDHAIIDQYNIYQATQITMKEALLHLLIKAETLPETILIDAMPINLDTTPYENIPIFSFTQGESKSSSIAAASILAKVTRDTIVSRLHDSFPSYQLTRHKGYATKVHQQAIKTFKASIIHRKTFLKKILIESEHEQQSLFR